MQGLDQVAANKFMLLDYGIHLFDFLCCIVDERRPRRVATVVPKERMLDGGEVPGLASTITDFGDSQAVVSMNANARGFFGHHTQIVADQGVTSTIRDTPGSQSVAVRTATGTHAPQVDGAWVPEGFIGSMIELLAPIEEDREPKHSARNNLATLELTLQAMAAASTT